VGWRWEGKAIGPPVRHYDKFCTCSAADRESGDAIAENRRFLRRAAAFLAEHAGIQQFLDIGTGIPTSPNVHEIVQVITPASRVVYVDNDPIVLAHARALLTSSPRAPPPTSTPTCVTPAGS